jgi:hypothetical protein
LLGALCQRLPEGDDVAIFTGATSGSYHLSSVVGEQSVRTLHDGSGANGEIRLAGEAAVVPFEVP